MFTFVNRLNCMDVSLGPLQVLILGQNSGIHRKNEWHGIIFNKCRLLEQSASCVLLFEIYLWCPLFLWIQDTLLNEYFERTLPPHRCNSVGCCPWNWLKIKKKTKKTLGVWPKTNLMIFDNRAWWDRHCRTKIVYDLHEITK